MSVFLQFVCLSCSSVTVNTCLERHAKGVNTGSTITSSSFNAASSNTLSNSLPSQLLKAESYQSLNGKVWGGEMLEFYVHEIQKGIRWNGLSNVAD
jgi:hypothetical protein